MSNLGDLCPPFGDPTQWVWGSSNVSELVCRLCDQKNGGGGVWAWCFDEGKYLKKKSKRMAEDIEVRRVMEARCTNLVWGRKCNKKWPCSVCRVKIFWADFLRNGPLCATFYHYNDKQKMLVTYYFNDQKKMKAFEEEVPIFAGRGIAITEDFE